MSTSFHLRSLGLALVLAGAAGCSSPKTSKRMIYYYFTSKEQLYVEVLEKLYGDQGRIPCLGLGHG